MSRFDDIFEEDIEMSRRTDALTSRDMARSAPIIRLEDRRSKILRTTNGQRQINAAKLPPPGGE